jgi:hypothetical protein
MKRRTLLAVLFALVTVVVATGTAGAGDNDSGFQTSQDSMLTPLTGGTATPIITVGDTIRDYRFEAIPDGISLDPNGEGTVDVYVNHETSTVPFQGTNDFDNAQVSRLRLNQHSAGVLTGELTITSAENFQRFCSNYLATAKEGFERSIFFTNEETSDFVNRTGAAWPAGPNAEQAGVVVATDVRSGNHEVIYGMGRHNHENDVAIPGYGHPVVLSGDDTFSSNPPSSQLYSYIADSAGDVMQDKGELYGFVSDDPAVDDYYDFTPTEPNKSVSGHFVKIDKSVAQGDQTALENASDAAHVFQFVRLEDIAYDKRPGKQNIVYVADTGRGSTAQTNGFASTNGRVWKFVFDPDNPTHVLSLSVLIQGDDNPMATPTEIHQPDNLETTQNGLYITEDPSSGSQFPVGSPDPPATTARLWQHNLTTGVNTPVAKVDQSSDNQGTDTPGSPLGMLGSWETSGVIDASSVFGPGSFLIDVQAHTLWIEQAPGPGFTWKREGGQLLLLRIPNA